MKPIKITAKLIEGNWYLTIREASYSTDFGKSYNAPRIIYEPLNKYNSKDEVYSAGKDFIIKNKDLRFNGKPIKEEDIDLD